MPSTGAQIARSIVALSISFTGIGLNLTKDVCKFADMTNLLISKNYVPKREYFKAIAKIAHSHQEECN